MQTEYHSSLTRDASAPQHLPEQEKKCIEMDPELNKLKIERNALVLEDAAAQKHHA
jgi:hypothetical protein